MRRGGDRAGALLAGHGACRAGEAASRLDRGDRGHGFRGGCAAQGPQRALQPIRGAAGPACLAARQIFHQGGERLGDQPRHSRQGRVPRPQSDPGWPGARHLRRDLLPQRADLFRRRHQAPSAGPARRDAGKRRLSRAGRGGDDDRAQPRFRRGAGAAITACSASAQARAARAAEGQAAGGGIGAPSRIPSAALRHARL